MINVSVYKCDISCLSFDGDILEVIRDDGGRAGS